MTLDTQAAPATVADTGPMTLEAIVDRQMARQKTPPAEHEPAPSEETTAASPEGEGEEFVETSEDSEAAPQAADDGDEAPETDTLETEQVQEPDPAQPKLEAPARWEAEDKALFATLPKKAQETILRREKLQQAEVTKAQQKSAEITKTFETRIQHLNTLAETIGEHYVEPGQARMRQWEDWFASDDAKQLARSDPGAYLEEQARHQQERIELSRALKAKRDAESEAFEKFRENQSQQMLELIPEFADEAEGGKRKSELGTYLRDQGFEPDRIAGISAKEAQLAWKSKKLDAIEAQYAKDGGIDALVRDAELYRKSVKLATKPPPPKPKVNAGPSAPAAGQGQTPSSSEARFKALSAKKSLTIDEAAEKAELRQKLRK